MSGHPGRSAGGIGLQGDTGLTSGAAGCAAQAWESAAQHCLLSLFLTCHLVVWCERGAAPGTAPLSTLRVLQQAKAALQPAAPELPGLRLLSPKPGAAAGRDEERPGLPVLLFLRLVRPGGSLGPGSSPECGHAR